MSTESDAQPDRPVTVNQVVAWNIAWYRRAAGLTQAQLAGRLGWTQAKVSEAERSWKGERTREFNAQELAELSLALGVPLAGLLLPPEDDGNGQQYVFPGPGGKENLPMGALLARVLLADPDDFSDQMAAYQQRLVLADARYLARDWPSRLGRLAEGEMDREVREDLAERLMARVQGLMDAATDFAEVAQALRSPGGREEEAGQ